MPDLRDDQGATMAEYALMVAFVAMAALLAVTMFGGALRDLFQNAADLMP
jgi:Flp pilus assembly pilin Flp